MRRKRIIVCLTEEEYQLLKNEAMEKGVSMSSIIRELILNLKVEKPRDDSCRGIEAGINWIKEGKGFFGEHSL